MPNNDTRHSQQNRFEQSPALITGAILAIGVIRILDSQDALDNLTEQSVSTGCPDHQGETQ
jgi:hypothetical protein